MAGSLRRVGIIVLAGCGMLAGLGAILVLDSSGEQEVLSLASQYGTDGVSRTHSRFYGSSSFGGYTLTIAAGGSIHYCTDVRADDLRQRKPITCTDGTVIHAK